MNNKLNKIFKGKNRFTIMALMIVLVALVTLGVSYSYLGLNLDESQITNIDANVGNVENFIFTPGTELNLTSVPTGHSGTTNPKATLISGATGNTIDSTYDVYLEIGTNTFEYTKDGTPPAELLLKIINPAGVEITEIEGLNYVTVEGHSGFDLTTHNGFVPLVLNYPISSDNSTTGVTQEWDITLSLVDLSIDQTHNNGKTFTGNIIIKNGVIQTLSELIFEHNDSKEVLDAKSTPYFGAAATANEGMYATEDDYGTSYYYRGAVDNNWVYFAGFYWRIVRVNGDGSVRMIYTGATAPTEAQKVVMTGSNTTIGSYPFNTSSDRVEYAGYMYTIGEQHGNGSSSNAKLVLDEWYKNNIYVTNYHNYVSDSLFCSDRTFYSDEEGTTIASGIGKEEQHSGVYIRNVTNKSPVLTCPDQRDAFTVNDTVNGNSALVYPVGLLTVDEISFTGTNVNYDYNRQSYLYNSSHYWTLSSFKSNGNYTYIVYMNSTGSMNEAIGYSNYALRPVISLKSTVLSTGTGEWNDPYIVL